MMSVEAFRSKVGEEIGVSDWLAIEQDRINAFADATDDHQFIHVDPEAAAKTPFGGAIAHGFLTLSMLSRLAEDCDFGLEGTVMSVNYGFQKIRFVEPVPAGGEIRARFVLKSVDERAANQILATLETVVDIKGRDKPALVAEWLGLHVIEG